MAGTFVLRLIIYGLAAFVPDPGSNGLTVLLPDARGTQFSSDGCRITAHIPALYVASDGCRFEKHHCNFASELDDMFGLPKKEFGVQGSWVLNGEDLSISLTEPKVEGLLVSAKGKIEFKSGVRIPGSKTPSKDVEAADFSWIATPSVGRIVSRSCLVENKSLQAVNCPIVARLKVEDGVASVCHVSEVSESKDKGKICPVSMGSLLNNNKSPGEPQAIADAVMVTMELPRDRQVVLNLQPFGGGAARKILLDPGKRPEIDIWLINQPTSRDAHGKCHSDDIDKHFEMYYSLSEPIGELPIPLADRPIPHRLSEGCIDGAAVQPKCPILQFDHPGQPGQPDQGGIPGDKPACGHIQLLVGGDGK